MKRMLCVFVTAICLLLLSGCGNRLSNKEIEQANLAFRSDTDSGAASEISCFFTCYYSNPREIDLHSFLEYCPAHVMLADGDEEEFLDWLEAVQWPDYGKTYTTPYEFHVPVWRYRKTDVSELLMKYAGISVDDLESIGDAVYMEKYDAFYNMTSDYGPGRFEAVGGEQRESSVRFWSETDRDGMRNVLTLERVEEQYLIRSFLQEKTP